MLVSAPAGPVMRTRNKTGVLSKEYSAGTTPEKRVSPPYARKMPVNDCPGVPVTLKVSLGSGGCVEAPLKMNHATAATNKMQAARIARPLFMMDSCRLMVRNKHRKCPLFSGRKLSVMRREHTLDNRETWKPPKDQAQATGAGSARPPKRM